MNWGKAIAVGLLIVVADYDLRQGGWMGFGLLVMLIAPALAAKLRRVD